MKSVVISAVITAVIIVSSICYDTHLTRVSEKLISINDRVICAVDSENYESALYILNEISECMEAEETLLAITDNHEVVHNIEKISWQIHEYIECGEKADALSNCRALSLLFKQLPEDYKIKLDNIL